MNTTLVYSSNDISMNLWSKKGKIVDLMMATLSWSVILHCPGITNSTLPGPRLVHNWSQRYYGEHHFQECFVQSFSIYEPFSIYHEICSTICSNTPRTNKTITLLNWKQKYFCFFYILFDNLISNTFWSVFWSTYLLCNMRSLSSYAIHK